VPTLSTVNGYIERLRTNPGAYTPEVRSKIEWRIGITGQALRRAVPAGVRIAFGTDAGVSMHGRNADEFLLMVEHGMTPMTAIAAATVNAADLLGITAEAGTIEPGKSADIVAVRGDPLADVGVLRSMNFVMARGRIHRQEP
jgi:imidazolonepropionase-like amidohydrolase